MDKVYTKIILPEVYVSLLSGRIINMRKIELFLGVMLVVGNLLIAQSVDAIGITTPFGGRVTATTLGNTYCVPGGTGPVSINPVGSFPPMVYYFQSYNTQGSHTAPSSGRYVLGNKMPLMVGSCYDDDGVVQTPHPAYRVTLFGVSKPNLSGFNFKTGK